MCLNYTPAHCQKCRGQSLLIYSLPLSYLRLFTIFFYNLERLKHSAYGRQQRQRETLHKTASFDMFWQRSADSSERTVSFYFNSISDELNSVESLVFEIYNFPGVWLINVGITIIFESLCSKQFQLMQCNTDQHFRIAIISSQCQCSPSKNISVKCQ